MRTTQELHIALDILLQKVSSHWNKNFLPQEKDWFLNMEINKFIKQRLNPLSNDKQQSMFDITKRIQDLNSLLETKSIEGINLTKQVYIPFPKDYLFYISSKAYVTCSSNIVSKSKKVYKFKPFNLSSLSTGFLVIKGNFINNIGNVNNVVITLFDSFTLPTAYLPQDTIPTYKKNFILNNAILNIVNTNMKNYLLANDSSIEDEDLVKDDFYFNFNKETGYFELHSDRLNNLTIFIGNTPYNVITSQELYSGNSIDISKDKESSVRIIDEEVKADIENSYLSKPSEASVCGLLKEFSMRLPKLKGVILSGAKVTYLRQPRSIDLILGIDSELPDWVLDEVVAKTAETIQGVIGTDTYEKYIRENMMIE